MLSATVIHPSCMLADAYATSFMAMGINDSKEFLYSHPEIEVYFVYSDDQGNWEIFMTQGLEKNIKH